MSVLVQIINLPSPPISLIHFKSRGRQYSTQLHLLDAKYSVVGSKVSVRLIFIISVSLARGLCAAFGISEGVGGDEID